MDRSLLGTLSWLSRKESYIDGLVQDCSIAFANALEILQSSTKPSIWPDDFITFWSISHFYACTLRFTAFSILCIEAYFPGFRLYVGSYLMLYLFQLQLHMHGTYQRTQYAFLYETCLHYLCPIYSYTLLRWDTLNGMYLSAHVIMIITDDLAPNGQAISSNHILTWRWLA